MAKENVFVVPNNDLEAKKTIELLERNGYTQGENLFVTEQGWGASWEGLEPEIKEALNEKQWTSQIYGMELAGENSYDAIDIDHHAGRSNPLASIEQIASLIGATLSTEEKFVAANDKGYIPEMQKLADSYGMDEQTKADMIKSIRRMDWEAQGITEEQIKQAEAAVANREEEYELVTVHMPHSRCAPVTDSLFGQYDNLLIIGEDHEVNFYGNGAVCKELYEKFGGFASGDLSTSGFWGRSNISDDAIEAIENHVRDNLHLDRKDPVYPRPEYFKPDELGDIIEDAIRRKQADQRNDGAKDTAKKDKGETLG